MAPLRRSDQRVLVVVGLAVLIAATFSSGLGSGMVLDNQFIVQGDPRLRAATWENVRLIFTQDYWYPKSVGGLYRPLTTLSFLFNYTILGNGDAPAGYHWVNILLHLLNATLVYALMLRLLAAHGQAVASAALFAVHPVVVESVTNIVGRSDLLAAASVLGGLLIYLRSTEATGKARTGWLVLLGLTTALGVLCKENAAVIAGLLPLYDLAYRWRRAGLPAWRDAWAGARERFLHGYVAVVPAVLALGLIRVRLLAGWPLSPEAFVDNPMRGADFLTTRLTAVKVIGKYLWLMLCPLRLSADYSFDQVPVLSWRLESREDWQTVIAVIAVAAAVGLAARARGRRPALLFLIAFFFVTLAPTSNLVVLIDSMMAERFLYLPLVGFLGCAVMGVGALRWAPRVPAVLLAAAVAAASLRTFVRNHDWRSNVTLWASAREASPRSSRVHRSLAWALFGEDPELRRHGDAVLTSAERAMAILDPLPPVDNDRLAYLDMGIFARTRAESMARDAGARSDELTPATRPLYERALSALERARSIDQAQNVRHRQRELARGAAADDVPDVGTAQIYNNLGLCLARMGRHEEALAAYRDMVHLDPTDPAGYRRIADQQLLLGRDDDAAITLVQLLFMDERGPDIGQAVVRVYERLDHGPVPAVVPAGDGYQLNRAAPLVHTHACAAAEGLARLGLEARRRAMVAWARQRARDDGCDMGPFDRLEEPQPR